MAPNLGREPQCFSWMGSLVFSFAVIFFFSKLTVNVYDLYLRYSFKNRHAAKFMLKEVRRKKTRQRTGEKQGENKIEQAKRSRWEVPVEKELAVRTWRPAFGSWTPCKNGREELKLHSWPLTSACQPWCICVTAYIHYTQEESKKGTLK